MRPKFSIIIPVYNVAPYLEACLRSVVAASDKLRMVSDEWATEIICVDDGSTDGSGEILDAWAARWGHRALPQGEVRIIHQANAGVSAARNVALEAAAGEWIAACDPDDEVKPDWLLHFYEAICAHPEVRFFWTDIVCEDNGKSSVRDESYDKDALELIDEVIRGQFWGGMVNKVYHRETLNAHGIRCPMARVHSREDVILCCRYLLTQPLVHHIPHADYVYKIRKGSLIHHGRRPSFQEDLLLYAEFERVLGDGRFELPLRYLRQELRYGWYNRLEISHEDFAQTFPDVKNTSLLTRPFRHCVLFWLSAHGLRPYVLGFLRILRKMRGLT